MAQTRISEHSEQVTVIEWKNWNIHNYPELKWLHAIPNGSKLPYSRDKYGNRYSKEAKHLITEGLTSGIADLYLPVPRSKYHGLYIEMKAQGGKPTPQQEEFLYFVSLQGYKAVICYGAEDAIETIENYLNLPNFPWVNCDQEDPKNGSIVNLVFIGDERPNESGYELTMAEYKNGSYFDLIQGEKLKSHFIPVRWSYPGDL